MQRRETVKRHTTKIHTDISTSQSTTTKLSLTARKTHLKTILMMLERLVQRLKLRKSSRDTSNRCNISKELFKLALLPNCLKLAQRSCYSSIPSLLSTKLSYQLVSNSFTKEGRTQQMSKRDNKKCALNFPTMNEKVVN